MQALPERSGGGAKKEGPNPNPILFPPPPPYTREPQESMLAGYIFPSCHHQIILNVPAYHLLFTS